MCPGLWQGWNSKVLRRDKYLHWVGSHGALSVWQRRGEGLFAIRCVTSRARRLLFFCRRSSSGSFLCLWLLSLKAA